MGDGVDKKISISVWGCCVSRDSLAYRQDKYFIPRFVQSISPYSVMSGRKIECNIGDFAEYPQISNFFKRNICLDANKNAVEYLTQEKSDWLLLDMSEVRRYILECSEADILLTESSALHTVLPALKNYYGEVNFIVRKSYELDESILLSRVSDLCCRFLNFYNSERIILNEFAGVNDYMDDDGTIKSFGNGNLSETSLTNKLIKKANKVCELVLKGCKVIRMPPNNFAVACHKLGLAPLHYTDLYYDYVEKCISAIVQSSDKNLLDEQLGILYELYNQKMYCARIEAVNVVSGNKIKELNKKCVLLDQSISNLLAQKEELERRERELKDEISALEKHRLGLEGEIAKLKEQNAEILTKAEMLAQQNTGLKNRLTVQKLKLQEEQAEKKAVQKELSDIRASHSYKLGRAATYLPRKLRDALKRK